jgi:EAL and modified HD-GYP domain-containing signal transduction protein
MSDIFIARQPIFDRDMQVYAYELLFRASEDAALSADVEDGDSATSNVIINTFVNIGLEKIVGEHRAFINLTRLFLSNPDLIMLPPEQLVLEVLEDIEPGEALLSGLRSIRERGYRLALDDFVYDERFEPMIELADIIKIDVLGMSPQEIESLAVRLKRPGIRLLAEKVETYEEYELLKSLGFDYYQGYFFARPTVVKGKSLSANQVAVLELVAKVNNPQVEVDDLAEIIRADVSLSHKVLKFINSPASGLRNEVDSVHQAVVLLGLATIKNWVTILALANNSNKPSELNATALIRARSCELLAKASGFARPESFFTVGLFSCLDAMMDLPLEELVGELPLSQEARNALLDHRGELGEALNCTLAMEQGDFSRIGFGELDLPQLSDLYLDAIGWADQMMRQF